MMNSEDINVVIAAVIVFITALGVISCIAFNGFKEYTYNTGWGDGYVAAKEKYRRHV